MITKKTLLPLLTLSFLLSITSCKNFMSGSDFLNELQDAIAYTNAESFNVIVEADSVLGKINDSGKKEVKVKDKLSLSFEVNSEKHVFLGWTCVKAESGEDASANVEFEDILSPKTTVKFLKPGDVTIKPKCAERPYVKNFSPTYDQTGVGVAKNTSIIIEFAQKIETSETENILNKIIIESNGAVTSKFSPSMSEKIITIVSKELIDLKNGTQDVTVKVPGSYYYTTKDVKGNNVKVYLSPDYNGENEVYDAHSYLINSTTSTNTELIFSVEQTFGSLDFTGPKSINIGDNFQVTFKKNETVVFNQWEISAEGKTSDELINALSITFTEDNKNNTYTISGTANESIKGVKISPSCNVIPYAKDYSPKMDEFGVVQDSSIVIQFNKPINLEDFYTENDGLKNLSIKVDNIEIACNEDSTKNKFISAETSPLKNPDGTYVYTLTIKTDKESPIITSKNQTETKDIVVTLFTKTNSLKDGSNSSEYFTSDTTWTYRVKNVLDKENPIITEYNLYKDKDYTEPLNPKPYSEWELGDDTNFWKRNHVNQMYLNISGTDNDSISKLIIQETLIRDSLGTEYNIIYDSYELGTGSFVKKDNKYTLEIPYSISPSYDGEYDVSFTLADATGNKSNSITYHIIKDTANTSTFNLYTEIPSQFINNKEIEKSFFEELSLKTTQNVRIHSNTYDIWAVPEQYVKKQDYGSYTISYGHENNFKNSANGISTIANFEDNSKPLNVKANSKDTAGNISETYAIIPPKPIVNNVYLRRVAQNKNNNNNWEPNDEGTSVFLNFEIQPFEGFENYYLYVFVNTGTNYSFQNTHYTSSIKNLCTIDLNNSKYESDFIGKNKKIELYFVWSLQNDLTRTSNSTTNIIGLVSDCYTPDLLTSSNFDNTLKPLEVKDEYVKIESYGINSETHKLTVSLPSLAGYDKAYIECVTSGSGNLSTIVVPNLELLADNKYSASVDISTKKFYKFETSDYVRNDYKFKVCGVKGVNCIETEYTIKSDDTRIINNIPPYQKTSINSNTLQEGFTIPTYVGYGSELCKNNDGNEFIKIYYAPLEDRWTYSSFEGNSETNCSLAKNIIEKGLITKDYIFDYFSSFEYAYAPGDTNDYKPISVKELKDGKYLICIYAEDVNGNYTLQPFRYYTKKELKLDNSVYLQTKMDNYHVYKRTGPTAWANCYASCIFNSKIPYPTWYSSDNNPEDYLSKEYLIKYKVQYYDSTDQIWEFVKVGSANINEFLTTIYTDKRDQTTNLFSVMPAVEFTNQPKFIRIAVGKSEHYKSSILQNEQWSYYRYYYTGFVQDDGTKRCEIADCIETSRGIVVYASDPCLIETLYSDTDWGDNVELWEYHVSDKNRVGQVLFCPTSGTYTDENSQQVTIDNTSYAYSVKSDPNVKGKYCRILVHFADGTSVLSSLK